jgi:dolichyl-phosphate beta-glucosyltransferase
VISLILPAYNPGSTIDRTWDSVCEFLQRRTDPWEVLFVLDGCTDGTAERLLVRQEETGDPRLGIVTYPRNQGKGHAVRVGLQLARGEYRIFTDVDMAYGFADVVRIADTLKTGAAVAIASREHPESLVQLPPRHLGYAYRRRVQSQIFGFLARTLLPITIRDTQAGLKGMNAAVAEDLLPRMACQGFGFDCELLTACARAELPVTEVPICVKYEDAASTTGAGSTLRMLRELWQIRKRWRKMIPAPQPISEMVQTYRLATKPIGHNAEFRAA